MKQSKRIAVTGGIGSGKSAVMALLSEKGYPVFSCDEIYRELCGEEDFVRGLCALFPHETRGGTLDRRALAEKVFADEEALKRLNAYAHPPIMRRLMEKMTSPLSFAEVPLLFEGHFESLFDGVVVVMRERSARVAALKARNRLSEEEIALRMARQYDYEKLPAGCLAVRNDGTLSDLRAELDAALAVLLR